MKIKDDFKLIQRKNLLYLQNGSGEQENHRPWLADVISPLYDVIMQKSVFPKNFGGDITLHNQIMQKQLGDVHDVQVLELGTGSGTATAYLSNDNRYTGLDISPGLLKIAQKKFTHAGFADVELFVTSAEELPFENEQVDVCLCILSLNFFNNLPRVFQEISRVLVAGGRFICVVPIPERNILGSQIQGTLLSEDQHQALAEQSHMVYQPINQTNGCLLYYQTIK